MCMQALTTQQAMERFCISKNTILEFFKKKGSPAYKIGTHWRVDEEDFKAFLLKESEKDKS